MVQFSEFISTPVFMKKFGFYKIFVAILVLAALYAGYFYFIGRFAFLDKEFENAKKTPEKPPIVEITEEPIKKEFTIHDLPPRPVNPLRDKDGRIYSDSGNGLGNPPAKFMDPNQPYSNN